MGGRVPSMPSFRLITLIKRHFGPRTSIRVELIAGFTTFLTMAYIVVVNAQILSAAGMPKPAVITATCLSAALASFLMGIWARLPVGLAPGMGTNAYFAYFVCGVLGVPWPTALGAVFLSGMAFFLLSLTGIREKIIDAIPQTMKSAIAAGIGLLIAFVGLRNAGVVVDHPEVLVKLGALDQPSVLVFFVGLVTTTVLAHRKVPAALLLGIIVSTALSIVLGASEIPKAVISSPPSIGPTLLALDIPAAMGLGMVNLVFTFLFVDLFDTIATLVAVTEHGGLTVKSKSMVGGSARKRIPRATAALASDALGTMAGALLGTSTVTSYIESSAGISAGGRTGLTAVVVGGCFLVAPIFAPLITAVPPAATAPALVMVAVMMMRSMTDVRFDDLSEAMPAMLVFVAIPLTFSISDGLALGFVCYPVIALLTGRKQQLSPLMLILGGLFVLKYVYLS